MSVEGSNGAIDRFLDMIAAERGAARNTIEAYRRDLTDYAGFLAGRGTSTTDVDTASVRAYLVSLQTRGFEASSAARRLSSIRQLHRFLVSENLRGDDPAAILDGPRQRVRAPKILSVAEVDELIEAARAAAEAGEGTPAQGLRAARLYALVELLYATGLRVSELVALPRTAARTKEAFISIRGK